MSDDATYVVIRGGQARYAYGRWGAQAINTDVLRGPEATLAFILDELRETAAPFLARYLEGYVCVDCDRRELLYWHSSGLDALSLRTHLELVRGQWPGWTCAWPLSPARALARRLPEHAEAILALTDGRSPVAFEDFVDLNARFPDLIARGDPDTLELIEEFGLALAQLYTEPDEVDAWLSLRRPDGGWDHQIFHDLRWGSGFGGGLDLGPAILAILVRRPQGGVEFVWRGEDDLEVGYLVDPQARTLDYWCTSMRIGDERRASFEAAWPGWTCRALTDAHDCVGGALVEHVRRVGLEPGCLRDLAALESLREDIERWLGPRSSGADHLTAGLRALELEAGQRVTATLPSPGDRGPGESEGWRERVAAHAARLLRSPGWRVSTSGAQPDS